MIFRFIVSIGVVRFFLIIELDFFFDSCDGFVVEFFVFEYESKFFKSVVEGFRIEKEYDNEFKGNLIIVDSQVVLVDGGDSNRVNVIREEICEFFKDLLDVDIVVMCSIGLKFDKVCCEEKYELV